MQTLTSASLSFSVLISFFTSTASGIQIGSFVARKPAIKLLCCFYKNIAIIGNNVIHNKVDKTYVDRSYFF